MFKEIEAGVPQDSVIGPILHTLYTSNLPKDENVRIVTYADDSTLLGVGKDKDEASEKFQTHFNKTLALDEEMAHQK